VVFAALPAFAADREARVHAFCHAVPGMWHAMGVMLNAGGALRWLRDVTGGAAYDELMAEAEPWEPGVEGLTFLPYLAGERTPIADPDARGAFAGLSLRHDRGALARAVLEGVAFGLRDSLDLLRELGVDAQLARASGGGAASDLFLRVVASALQVPVERVAVDEGAAYGAALLAGVGAGEFASVQEAAALVRPTATIEPAWDLSEPLARYRALYPALRGAPSR
jgi:xylulokinase